MPLIPWRKIAAGESQTTIRHITQHAIQEAEQLAAVPAGLSTAVVLLGGGGKTTDRTETVSTATVILASGSYP